MRSDRSLVRSVADWLPAVVGSMASVTDQGFVRVSISRSWRRLLLLLFLGGGFRLALAFRFVGVFVVRRARRLRDLAHDLPGLLVGDRHKAIVAVEFLLHRLWEPEAKEAIGDLLGKIGLEVVGVGKRGGREDRA